MKYYFSKKQDSKLDLRKIKVHLRDKYFEFYTGSGVFSKSKLDKGSELLINSIILKDKWKILDLGTGWGAVGVVVAKLFPSAKVIMLDINQRAVKLAKMNLKLNNVEAEVKQSDLFEKINSKFNYSSIFIFLEAKALVE